MARITFCLNKRGAERYFAK